MGHHSEDEVKRLVAEIDTDGNNEIDFDEFLSFVLHHLPGKPDPVKEARFILFSTLSFVNFNVMVVVR